jgi:predicted GTPase
VKDLAATIARADCDAVVIATPIDLARVIRINKPSCRVEYALQEIGRPNLADTLEGFIKRRGKGEEEKNAGAAS